jgi:hypothetical protein
MLAKMLASTCLVRRYWFLTWIMMYDMIGAHHTLRTHVRSTSYIYNVFWHLLLWPMFIRMQPQQDICLVSQSHGSGWRITWILTWIMLHFMLGRCTHFIHMSVLLHLYIMRFSTFYHTDICFEIVWWQWCGRVCMIGF